MFLDAKANSFIRMETTHEGRLKMGKQMRIREMKLLTHVPDVRVEKTTWGLYVNLLFALCCSPAEAAE